MDGERPEKKVKIVYYVYPGSGLGSQKFTTVLRPEPKHRARVPKSKLKGQPAFLYAMISFGICI